MYNLLFLLALVLTTGLIYLLTGRNRRQINRIPEGMAILCQPPGKRYVLYALGVLVLAVVLFFTVLFVLDGAPEGARFSWGLCIALAILLFFLCLLGGSMMARDCVYFDGEKFQIEKPFRKPQVIPWSEVQRIEGSFDHAVTLYLRDETKVLTADAGMVNFEQFCTVLKLACPGPAANYYRAQTYEEPQNCILRCGSEYYLLSMMAILIFLLYLAMLITSEDGPLFLQNAWQMTLQSGPSEWFAIWFAPVAGVVGIIALFFFLRTRVRYSPEKLILTYPLRKKREITWREIQRIEVVPARKQGEGKWKKVRLYTAAGICRLDLSFLTHGKDSFMAELFKMVARYEIPCTAAKK